MVQRVREMWELNTMQKDMLSTLRAEGFNVTESGLMRLRIKHGLQLKSPKNIIRDAIADKPTTLDANDASILEVSMDDAGITFTSLTRTQNSGDISIQGKARMASRRPASDTTSVLTKARYWQQTQRPRRAGGS